MAVSVHELHAVFVRTAGQARPRSIHDEQARPDAFTNTHPVWCKSRAPFTDDSAVAGSRTWRSAGRSALLLPEASLWSQGGQLETMATRGGPPPASGSGTPAPGPAAFRDCADALPSAIGVAAALPARGGGASGATARSTAGSRRQSRAGALVLHLFCRTLPRRDCQLPAMTAFRVRFPEESGLVAGSGSRRGWTPGTVKSRGSRRQSEWSEGKLAPDKGAPIRSGPARSRSPAMTA